MSYYSEKDEAIFYNSPTKDEIELYLILNWEELKENNYIWEDINGKRFKENQIDNRYLKNIIRYCRRNFRPQEQIAALNDLALRRGIEWHA